MIEDIEYVYVAASFAGARGHEMGRYRWADTQAEGSVIANCLSCGASLIIRKPSPDELEHLIALNRAMRTVEDRDRSYFGGQSLLRDCPRAR